MLMLILGLLIFYVPHSISIIAPHWRDRMKLHIGTVAWRSGYSIVSLIGFVLIVVGFGQSRLAPIVLYSAPPWLYHLTYLLMVPVFPMLLAAYLPGRIQATLKHPMLAAIKLWATAHLLVNGTLADVLLFGSFLIWAVVDRIALKSRARPPRPPGGASRMNDVLAVVIGLGLYALFILRLHSLLIGRSLWPLP